MEKIAVIDLGSNSVRMTINHLHKNGSYRMVEEVRAMVRLSEHMGDDCILQEEPMKRTIMALSMFRKLMKVHGTETVIPVATAAVRQAANRHAFLDRVLRETGFSFRVITGEEEAWYDYLGVVNTVGLDTFHYIDIGGASTEVGYVENRSLVGSVSLPWGAVNITEHFGIAGKSTKKKCLEAEKFMMSHISELSFLQQNPQIPLVGLGGTIRTLAKVDKKRKTIPIEGIHQYPLTADTVKEDYNAWLEMGVQKKRAVPGLGKNRADIISGALTPLIALLKHTKASSLVISGHGLREGVFFEDLSKRLAWPKQVLEDVRCHHIENIMKLYGAGTAHAEHVEKLALSAFDQLSGIFNIPQELRRWLGCAARLHDIGTYIDYYNHHQHSFYLVMNTSLNGFSHRERVIVACLCGMHRENSDLKIDMKPYDAILQSEDVNNIRRMAPFLMLAERLDRSESGVVQDIRFRVHGNAIHLMIHSSYDVQLEMNAVTGMAIVFEKIYGKTLTIQAETGRKPGSYMEEK